MLVKIFSGAVNGIEATTITLEVNILNGAKFIHCGLTGQCGKRKSATDRFGPAGDRFPDSGQAGNHQYGILPMSKRKALLMISHSVSVFWLPTNNSRPKGWRIL